MPDRSDDEVEAAATGRPAAPATVHLTEPDEGWAAAFEAEAARLRRILGPVALGVDHVGSTSVPGLVAKPIIDIVLTVADPADEATYVPALETAGYVVRIREPEWFDHRLLKGPDVDVNVHVFGAGCPEIHRMIRFRDRLRRDPAERRLYEDTKRRLAARPWPSVQDYADAKDEVVADILSRAP